MVRKAVPALSYTPGTPFNEEDLLRYVNDEFNKIANAFKQITDSGVDKPVKFVDGDVQLSGFEQTVLVSVLAEVTLPSAVGLRQREINIIRTGTGDVTITPTGSETISGDTFLVLTDQWDSVAFVSDGTNWVRCS
jgi:virulence-associated protein VagC